MQKVSQNTDSLNWISAKIRTFLNYFYWKAFLFSNFIGGQKQHKWASRFFKTSWLLTICASNLNQHMKTDGGKNQTNATNAIKHPFGEAIGGKHLKKHSRSKPNIGFTIWNSLNTGLH